MPEKTNFAVVVPCYNEERVIPFFEKELLDFYQNLSLRYPNLKVNFIVVDNNSTDNSRSLLDALALKHSDYIKVISCSQQGYGAALKAGFASASSYKYIAFLDLDNTYPMLSLFEMHNKMENENLDIIYGARMHPKSQIGRVRKIGNGLYVGLLRLLLSSPLTDVCSGMRMFKSTKLQEILMLKDDGLSFSIQFSSYVLSQKWKLNEIPIHYRDRVGESKLHIMRDGFKFLFSSLKVSLFTKKAN
jgi:glycosyltransferase involved in cell wall biosynthesis